MHTDQRPLLHEELNKQLTRVSVLSGLQEKYYLQENTSTKCILTAVILTTIFV